MGLSIVPQLGPWRKRTGVVCVKPSSKSRHIYMCLCNSQLKPTDGWQLHANSDNMARLISRMIVTSCLLITLTHSASGSDDCLPERCQPIQEYCDTNQGRCSLCSQLCYAGQGNEASCARNCPEYMKQYMDRTTTSSSVITYTKLTTAYSKESRQDGDQLDSDRNLAIIIPTAVVVVVLIGLILTCRRRLFGYFARRGPSSEALFPHQEENASASTSFHTGMGDQRLNGDGFVAAMLHYPANLLRSLTGRPPYSTAVTIETV